MKFRKRLIAIFMLVMCISCGGCSQKNKYSVQEEPYREILDNYYYAISEKWDIDKMEENNVCYMCCWRENVSEMGYICIDVDGNGVSELLIGEVESEGAYVGMFYDMYTIVDNKAVQIVQWRT